MTAIEFVRNGAINQTGPGTELKKILASFGIKEESGCNCDSMAARMNRLGAEGCRVLMSEIVAHLEAQGAERGWPENISRFGARALVRWAILKSK